MSLFLPARGDDFERSNEALPLTGDVAQLVALVDEHSLVARVRGGDQEALGAIFQAYAVSLYGYVERLVRSRAVAQEVVHDTFVALWVNRSAWVVRGTVAAYLHGAVRNRALNYLRRCQVEGEWARAAVESGADDACRNLDLAKQAELRDLVAATERAIDRLPARCREVYLLHRQHQLSYAEIAQVLGLSPKTVERHIGRALKLLRAMLSAYLGILVVLTSPR